jgi:hypothetical protein
MSAQDYLYRVDDSGSLQTFRVLLGHGTYVNVMREDSKEVLLMQNRFNMFRETPEAAWSRHATSLRCTLNKARGVAKAGLRRMAMLNRIRADYSRKFDDLKSAEDRVWTDLTGILRIQDALNDALAKAGTTSTTNIDALVNTV